MAREDDDLQENPRVTRATRRDQPSTDRLSRGAVESDPVNPNWRSDRGSGRARSARSMPFSRQEFALWLQYGGWRFILAAVAILVVGGALYILSQPGPTPLPQTSEEPAEEAALAPTLPAFATVTPSALTPMPATAAPASLTGQQLRVTGTEGLGLFLRAEPTTANQPLKTLAENSIVTVISEPTTAEGVIWLRVRDEAGSEGWAAQEFLQPAQ